MLAAEAQHVSNLPAYIIEKDYWVTQTLEVLYSKIAPTLKSKCDKPFLFKGGTSLSKGYGLINRMSEDIDLSFSLDVLECSPINCAKITGRNARQEEAKKIDQKAEVLIEEMLKDEIEKHLLELDPRIKVEIESKLPLNIAIYYPKALDDSSYGGSVQPRVLLETGGRSDNHPDELKPIQHMLGQAIPDLEDSSFEVLTLSAERTLLEKMFGIHTNHTRAQVADKHARHLYDIVEIDAKFPDWCKNKELFQIVVHFCDVYYKWHKESCDSAKTGPLILSPQTDDMHERYNKDWNSMADMFPRAELPYTFEQLVEKIKVIESKANQFLYS
ncbi:TPA: nucleotidyl transferase AbiEii/AbiGii toxin family protein [Vibrio diabolicus]|uniref:nucleotidyl transferase AbiEii/AbiGii toxin family protein n=1 Tax=Vibrio diabolicus TaxID=50719 RepID=UPI00215F164D|nr:nucleotidyl transferase AbiEii/AbiGii toxin family protein [Vibrio diabolicus]